MINLWRAIGWAESEPQIRYVEREREDEVELYDNTPKLDVVDLNKKQKIFLLGVLALALTLIITSDE